MILSRLSEYPESRVVPGGRLVGGLDWSSDPSLRMGGVGASEAAAALGLDDYTGPLALWEYKTGRREREDISGVAAVRLGHVLEPYLLDSAARLGAPEVEERQVLVARAEYPFLHATLDGVSISGEPIEAKTINPRARGASSMADAAERGEDPSPYMPERWRVQVHQQMLLTGADRAHLLVCVLGVSEHCIVVDRDRSLVDRMVSGLAAFWECVARDRPPRAGHVDLEILKAVRPTVSTAVSLPAGAVADADEASRAEFELADIEYEINRATRDLKERKRRAEARLSAARARLYQWLGEHSCGILPDGRRVEAPMKQRKGYTVEPKESRSISVRGSAHR